MNADRKQKSFAIYRTAGRTIDPVHIGTGGARLGRVDNAIVRDPVTRVPKIPGSSLAGVHRSYAAMACEEERGDKDRCCYPQDAGQVSESNDGKGPINAVYGHRKFAGLAGFSDAHVLLFPVPSCKGPAWVTSPMALRAAGGSASIEEGNEDRAHRGGAGERINLGWLQLEVTSWRGIQKVRKALEELRVAEALCAGLKIVDHLILVTDKLFGQIVNSNLEVRTSVSIDPTTGAAKDSALFTYEALPRETILIWDVICRHPRHFEGGRDFSGKTTADVHALVKKAHPYLGALGIGGMGTRGMGRLEVLGHVAVGEESSDQSEGGEG